MDEWNDQIKYSGRFLEFVDRQGWEFVRRINCTGIVIIVPQTDDGRVVCVEQFRPALNAWVIEWPAGLVNDQGVVSDESMTDAAQRELLEETGFEAAHFEESLTGPVNAGASANVATFYLATGLMRRHSGGGVDNERIHVHTPALAHINQWLYERSARGCLIEPKFYTGLYLLQSYNCKLQIPGTDSNVH